MEHALVLLPEESRANRFAAHHILAIESTNLGDLEGALRHLDAAIDLVGDDVLARAAAFWRRAKLAIRLGDPELAFRSFEAALPLYIKQAGAAEVVGIAFEYAALLLKEDRRPELRALAADVSGWVHQLKGNRKLRDLIADFKALVDLGQLDSLALGGLRQKLAAAPK